MAWPETATLRPSIEAVPAQNGGHARLQRARELHYQEQYPVDQDTITVLLTCFSYAGDTTRTERLAHIPYEKWREVAALARQQGVAPLLYHRLKQMGVELPGAVAEELRRTYYTNIGRNLVLYGELGKVLQRLQEKNIAVIVLKGAYLAEAVYENIGLRSMCDIDLLVKQEDLLRVEQELLRMGYSTRQHDHVVGQENKHFVYVLTKSGLQVEIHWALFEGKHPFQIDLEGLWSRTQPVRLAQVPALALSYEDLLLHLCLHTANHTYFMLLRMFYDIGELVRRKGLELDWQAIERGARDWGALRSVYVILRLAQELLGVAVPKDWLASIQPADFEERYLSLARQQIFAAPIDEKIVSSTNVSRLSDMKEFGRKLALICNRLLLSREAMAGIYRVPANSWRIYLYYPVRWKELLVRHSGLLRRLVRGDPKTQAEAERANQFTALFEWLRSD